MIVNLQQDMNNLQLTSSSGIFWTPSPPEYLKWSFGIPEPRHRHHKSSMEQLFDTYLKYFILFF
jgi:hypothetical protein